MNVRSLILSLALVGLCTGCGSEDAVEEGGSSVNPGTGKGSEIQLVFSGNGQSAEYDTRAISTPLENKISKLDIYIFASDAVDGTYYYLETWKMGATDSKADKTFTLQDVYTDKKAIIYPNELVGLPYLKLYCVANPQESLYQKDGTTPLTLTAIESYSGGATTPEDVTTEVAFAGAFTKSLQGLEEAKGNPIRPELIMTGSATTKISGSVSKVNMQLKRVVARFDIENNTMTSKLTIEKITMANARKNGGLFVDLNAAADKVEKEDFATGLISYNETDFSTIDKHNQGLAESALYVYPNLATDESYLVIKGTFKSLVDGSQVPVTYNIPIVKKDPLAAIDAPSPYIAIKRNNRYKLHILNVTTANIYGTFEVEDWTSDGGVIIKPDNAAPVFNGANDLEAIDGSGAIPTQETYDKNIYRLSDESGKFKMKLRASGHIVEEISQALENTPWLKKEECTYTEDEKNPGVIISTFTFSYTAARGKIPCRVTFRNDPASYDPALWTVITFAGPYATPALKEIPSGHSLGNTVDLTTSADAPTAEMYKVAGSEIRISAACVDGVTPSVPDGFSIETIDSTNYTITYGIRITDVASIKDETPTVGFKNTHSGEGENNINLTITLLDASMSAELATEASGKATLEGGDGTYTIKTDLEELGDGSYTLQIHAPQGVDVVLPKNKWLNVVAGELVDGVTSYTISKNAEVAAISTEDFNLVFINKLDATDQLTVTMHKVAAIPTFTASTISSDAGNSVNITNSHAATASMKLANDSKIYLKVSADAGETVTCTAPEGVSVTNVEGEWEVKVTDIAKFTAGGTTNVVFTNNNDNSRLATLTITWQAEQNPTPDPATI